MSIKLKNFLLVRDCTRALVPSALSILPSMPDAAHTRSPSILPPYFFLSPPPTASARLNLAAGFASTSLILSLSAKCLPVGDLWHGSSDPFVELCQGQRLLGRSRAMKAALNPNWGSVRFNLRWKLV